MQTLSTASPSSPFQLLVYHIQRHKHTELNASSHIHIPKGSTTLGAYTSFSTFLYSSRRAFLGFRILIGAISLCSTDSHSYP